MNSQTITVAINNPKKTLCSSPRIELLPSARDRLTAASTPQLIKLQLVLKLWNIIRGRVKKNNFCAHDECTIGTELSRIISQSFFRFGSKRKRNAYQPDAFTIIIQFIFAGFAGIRTHVLRTGSNRLAGIVSDSSGKGMFASLWVYFFLLKDSFSKTQCVSFFRNVICKCIRVLLFPATVLYKYTCAASVEYAKARENGVLSGFNEEKREISRVNNGGNSFSQFEEKRLKYLHKVKRKEKYICWM